MNLHGNLVSPNQNGNRFNAPHSRLDWSFALVLIGSVSIAGLAIAQLVSLIGFIASKL